MGSEGEQLGRYTLVRKLATGGMAEVFLAKAQGPGGFEKSLVIKRILPHLAKNPEFVSMFLNEARIAAQFAHPAVVQIFDFGEMAGTYFLAMEFVDGPNLRTILRAIPDRRLPLAVGARVIEEACEGLAYVHEFADPAGKPMGLIHFDVSTDNLLIAKNGAVKVVDFGVAVAGNQSNATQGQVKGKIAYMPPEQIIGEADLRADVYALGVILYELAAGTRPYETKPDQQLLADIIQTDPVPLQQRRPDVPGEYAAIVQKAMAKNLQARFQNCRELAAALEEFVTNSGQRVGTRQLSALAAHTEEVPAAPSKPATSPTPATATPYKAVSPAPISPPRGTPVAGPSSDPFASFGAPLPRASSAPVPPPPSSAPTAPSVAPVTLEVGLPKQKQFDAKANDLFDQFFSDLQETDGGKAAPAPVAAPPAPAPVAPPEPEPAPAEEETGMKVTVGSTGAPMSIEAFNAARAKYFSSSPSNPGTPRPGQGIPMSGLTPGPGKGLTGLTPWPSAVAAAPAPGLTPGPAAKGMFAAEPAHQVPTHTPGTASKGMFAAPPPSQVPTHTPGTAARGMFAAPPPSQVPTHTPGTAARGMFGPPGAPPAPPQPSRSGTAPAFVPPPAAPTPQNAPPEVRAQVLMAEATHMRLYEAGAPLASRAELEAVRTELERDEGVNLFARFPMHAGRLLKVVDEGPVLERVVGAIDGLLMAEAWGALATLLERLRASASIDPLHQRVADIALAQFATADQARRIAYRLREAPPTDAEGLGRLIPFFGHAFAVTWLELFETLDLPASRDAVLPGLAGLAALNAPPFIERLQPKRPRRLTELTYCIEKGRVPERQRVVRELMARLDPLRKREVLAGLARAASEDAFRFVSLALNDDDEATRVHAMQLLGKHFPDRVLATLQPFVEAQTAATRSDAERRAAWAAIGHSSSPAAFDLVSAELSLRAGLLNRGKADLRKVEVLEALAVMKTPQAVELLKRTAQDGSQGPLVTSAADGHVRSAALQEQTVSHIGEVRRWDRNPRTWRDVLLDLASLAAASRLVELDSAAFDVAFTRVAKSLAALLPAGSQGAVTCGAELTVNDQSVAEGADAAVVRALKAFQSRQVLSFTFTRQPPRAELEHLVRWLAAGPNAEGIETSSIVLQSATVSRSRPAPDPVRVAAMADFSREAMIRYVDLVLAWRAYLNERRANPKAEPPDTRTFFTELAVAAESRAVRFLGLSPRERNRDSELLHAANTMMLAVLFGAELGLVEQQLIDLASVAFFTDVGNFDLGDDLFQRAGRLTEADQQAVVAARKASARYPFFKLGDKAQAASWAAVVAEQDLDWGAKDRPGGTGPRAAVGLVGSLVALARAFEMLTTATGTREAMTRDQVIEVLSTRVPHRFRPELLGLFVRFLQRLSLRPTR
ncbi:MAG: protein kinase [Myxococcaceae bacterium]